MNLMEQLTNISADTLNNTISLNTNTKDFQAKISKLFKSGKKSILLTIVDLNNSTRYIGVKIK